MSLRENYSLGDLRNSGWQWIRQSLDKLGFHFALEDPTLSRRLASSWSYYRTLLARNFVRRFSLTASSLIYESSSFVDGDGSKKFFLRNLSRSVFKSFNVFFPNCTDGGVNGDGFPCVLLEDAFVIYTFLSRSIFSESYECTCSVKEKRGEVYILAAFCCVPRANSENAWIALNSVDT